MDLKTAFGLVAVDLVGTWGSGLACPVCGSTYLHQGEVEVFNREDGEEDARSVRTLVTSGGAVMSMRVGDNPSPRRQGLRIHFDCEECARHSALVILQHKGCTYVGWEARP